MTESLPPLETAHRVLQPRRLGWLVLALVAAAAVAAMLALPRIAQDPAYHAFADRRALLGIPNAADVLSSLAFLAVGLLGLRVVAARDVSFVNARERAPWAVTFWGVLLTAVGSAVYHLSPTNASLALDRLAMTVGFMGLLSALIAERLGARGPLIPLLVLGAATVVWWYASEVNGAGDLRPYVAVQAAPLVAIPLLVVLVRPRYTGSAWLLAALALYVAAKLAEVRDAAIFAATAGVVSGHTLKHLLAALGIGALVLMLSRRRPLPEPRSSRG
ncbi:hypothetical protein [Anaeromyxobacter sp. Fw109-5]|uniref:hypothetical protein n=1 Tax=Anaeromyxobacter sp. (strain Fw109-5) TaxID=404589 RepID=UPI0000ED6F92|nr:hypothetical protein [Anaeromyxobacter sp. Fw109-5]ABS27906.1 conserved hypothetical protein [Anaeromyxobacter sp. Fw109-5]